MFDLDSALRETVEKGGSDLHVKAGSPPMLRIDGELQPLDGVDKLTSEETSKALDLILTEPRAKSEFNEVGEADFSHAIRGLSRFRVNAFRQRGSVSIVCRAIPFQVKTVDELDLPEWSARWPKSSGESSSSPARPVPASRRPWRR